jgi:glycosyltransferase involved in cell wall biosynthesis
LSSRRLPARVAVIIPVFNERESLPLVVADIPRDRVDEIIVVDNG